MFKTRKVLNNITNVFYTEIKEFNITSFEECDRLDPKYAEIKANVINNDAIIKVQTINTAFANKLKDLEKDKAVLIKTATSLSWLALLVASIFIFIIILNDLHKLFSFIKENSLFWNRKRKNKKKTQQISDNKSEKENVFKQVMAKDKYLFNHSYFQNKRNMISNR
jgi:hypothetical protein